jgi:hypothetical protein
MYRKLFKYYLGSYLSIYFWVKNMVAMFPGSTLSQVWRANSPQLRELRTESGVSLFDALAENIRGAKVMVTSGKHTKSY